MKFFLLSWFSFENSTEDFTLLSGSFNVASEKTKQEIFSEYNGSMSGKLEVEEISPEEAIVDYGDEFWYHNGEEIDLEDFINSLN